MTIRGVLTRVLAGVILLAAVPVAGHHSFSAEFDGTKEIKATGKVTKLEWTNPHAWFYIQSAEICEGPAGSEKNNTWKCNKVDPAQNEWGFELASPNGLMRLGWSRNSLKNGDLVTVEGSRAKDGSRKGNARSVTIDGKRLFAGSSQTSNP